MKNSFSRVLADMIDKVMPAKICLLALAAVTALSVPIAAQAAQPDWTGVWVVTDSAMDRQDGTSTGIGGAGSRAGQSPDVPPPPPAPVFKGEYKVRADARRAAIRKAAEEGSPLPFQADDGCKPGPLDSSFWRGPYAFEIVSAPQQIIFFQEFLSQIRRVYLDGRPHPSLDEYDFSFKGHSTGRWEGDVLLVDTVGIRVDDKTFSDQLRVTERIWSPKSDYLQIVTTTTDSEALAVPWVAEYSLHRKADMEIGDYYCLENNRNPTDADGRTLTILGQ